MSTLFRTGQFIGALARTGKRTSSPDKSGTVLVAGF